MLYCYAAVTGKVSTNAQKCTMHPLKACDQYNYIKKHQHEELLTVSRRYKRTDSKLKT